MRVSSAWSSEPQLTPMRTGFWFSTAHSTMVRKLSSSLRPMETLPGLMRYLASALRAVGILLQQQVAVVVEVADDGRLPALGADAFDDVRHGLGGLIVVDGDADQLGAGAGERGDLLDGGFDVGGVGVGHRLDDDGGVGPDADAADVDGDGMASLDRWHVFILPVDAEGEISRAACCG